MKGTRLLRRWLSGAVLLALLFTRLATAAYACPSVLAAAAAMPCIGSSADELHQPMEAGEAALCLEHCKSGAQAVDAGHAPTPAAPASYPTLVVQLADADAGDVAAPSWTARALARERAPPPVCRVLYCCLRD